MLRLLQVPALARRGESLGDERGREGERERNFGDTWLRRVPPDTFRPCSELLVFRKESRRESEIRVGNEWTILRHAGFVRGYTCGDPDYCKCQFSLSLLRYTRQGSPYPSSYLRPRLLACKPCRLFSNKSVFVFYKYVLDSFAHSRAHAYPSHCYRPSRLRGLASRIRTRLRHSWTGRRLFSTRCWPDDSLPRE